MLRFGKFVFPTMRHISRREESTLRMSNIQGFARELEPTAYVQSVRGKPICCSGSSCGWEMRDIFRKLETDEDRGISEISLVYAFLGSASILHDKRGSDNTTVGGFFSILRMLGLRPRLRMNSMRAPVSFLYFRVTAILYGFYHMWFSMPPTLTSVPAFTPENPYIGAQAKQSYELSVLQI